jgi:hypothetical protein
LKMPFITFELFIERLNVLIIPIFEPITQPHPL